MPGPLQSFAGMVERPAMEQCLRVLTAAFCSGPLADEVTAVKVLLCAQRSECRGCSTL